MKTKSFSKRIVSVVIAMTMLMAMVPSIGVFAREYAAEVSINGVTVDFKNEPYSKNNVIFVPLEEIGGYLNLSMTKEGNVYTILRMGQTLKVESGNLVAFLDGKEVVLPTNPVEKNGVTYAPIEIFSKGFGCPVTVSDDKKSADIVPNVYRVSITEQSAAAVSAAVPDKDVLGTATNSVDTIFNNAAVFPELEKSVFYMIDLSAFSAMTVEKVLLSLNIDKAEYSPTLRIERTAPWKKGEVTYNTQPVSYESEYVTGLVDESNYVDRQYDIVKLANAAKNAGETLAIKLMGIPHTSKVNSKNNSFTIRGVNHEKAPYVEVYVSENYVFPVKTASQESEDFEEQRYSRIALLKSLGVFTQNDEFPLDLTEGVQRQEFVKYALRLRNASVQEASGEQFFSDVPTDAPFYNDVMTAHSMGLVSGWQGIAFRPYDTITLGEAITILGRMLNYNIFADERGGFTPGYFAAARNGDLYDGAEIAGEALSFKKMFKLLEDALDAKMLNVRTYTSIGTAEYTFDANMTILTEYWNAQVIEGQVTANEYSGFTDPNAGKEGIIEIDNGRKELKFTFEPYNEFLGYRVKAYYEKSEDKLLYMGIKEYDIKEIDLCDITGEGPKEDSTVSFIYKDRNGNTTKESFLKSNVIYNGKSIAPVSVSFDLLIADAGSILLVGDNLTVIKAYRTLTVYNVEAEEEVIYDKYDAYNNVLRLKGKDYIIRDISGKEVELSTLNTDDILSVAESSDGGFVTAILSTTKISGSVEAIEDSNTDTEVLTINGSEYRTRNLYVNKYDSTVEFWHDFVKVGADGTFLVDAFGSIVGFNPTKTTNVKGYFLTMGNAGSAIRSKLQIAVMVEGNEKYVVYDLADKVKIDGTTYKISSQETAVKNKFKDSQYGRQAGEYVTQGIIFDVNSDGKINRIDTADYDKDKESENNSLQIRRKIDDGTLKYKSNGSLGDYTNKKGLEYFIKPSQNLLVNGYKEGVLDEYETKTSGFANDANLALDIYTIGKRTPEAAIMYRVDSKSDSDVSDDPSLMLVDRIVTTFDADGLEVKKIYYYNGVARESVIVPDEMISKLKAKTADPTDTEAYAADPGNAYVRNKIERGDIIRFDTNDRGEITAIKECYDIENHEINTSISSAFGYNDGDRLYGGYTEMVDGSYLKIASTSNLSDTTWVESSKFSNFCRYEVGSSGVEVYAATLADVRTIENVPNNPTGILLYSVFENLRKNVWLIELDPPAIGRWTLTYDLGEYGESYNGVPENFVRSDSEGNIEVTEETPIGKRDTARNIAYEFTHWAYEDGTPVSTSVLTLTDHTTLTAQWEEIELPRYIYLKKSIGDTEASSTIPVYKTVDGYKTTVPTVKKSNGDYYFTQDGENYVDWVDGNGILYTPGGDLPLDSDLTLYPNWFPEVTEPFGYTKIELLSVTQAADGSQTVQPLSFTGDDYIAASTSETSRWYIAKIQVGENWKLSDLALSLKYGMQRGYYHTGFAAPLSKTVFETAKEASVSGASLTTLVNPLNNPDSLQTVFAGNSGNGNLWNGSNNSAQNRTMKFDATKFTAEHYSEGCLYVAFQTFIKTTEDGTDYAGYARLNLNNGSAYNEVKFSVTGGKTN